MNQPYNSNNMDVDDTINIRAEIENYLMYWKWFVLGVFVSLVSAFLYLRYTPSQYSAKSVVLIKESKKGPVAVEVKKAS